MQKIIITSPEIIHFCRFGLVGRDTFVTLINLKKKNAHCLVCKNEVYPISLLNQSLFYIYNKITTTADALVTTTTITTITIHPAYPLRVTGELEPIPVNDFE